MAAAHGFSRHFLGEILSDSENHVRSPLCTWMSITSFKTLPQFDSAYFHQEKEKSGLTVATFLNDDLTKTYRFILKQMIFATKTKLAFKEDLPSSLIPCCQMWQTGILIPGRWTRAVILKLHYLRTLYIHQND
ncbi:uncharacterized protein LOC144312737 [Canis aureus]